MVQVLIMIHVNIRMWCYSSWYNNRI